MKRIRFMLIQDCLMSAERKIDGARAEIKNEGKMDLGLESRFGDILTELRNIEKTVQSWDLDGEEV